MSKLWSAEEFDLCNRMIWAYARQYIREKGMHLSEDRLEDYVQEAWLKLSEYKKKNPQNEIWAGLIKKIVYGEFADLIHKDIKNMSLPLDQTGEDDGHGSEENALQMQDDTIKAQRMQGVFNEVGSNELIDLVDKLPDPLQKKYLMWFLEKSGIKDYGIRDRDFTYTTVDEDGEEKRIYKDGYTDGELAAYLGFKGTDDSKYKSLKQQMISILEPYIGRYNKPHHTRRAKKL